MPTKTLTSFEVLSNPIAPGVPDVPYVQQGFFMQISNLGTASALIGLEYVASPAFVAANGAIKLFTNIIDGTGMPQQYPIGGFLSPPVGYEALNIGAGATWLVGVQYLLLAPPPPIITPATGSTPQDAAMARGILKVTAAAGTRWMFLATVRQVFTNYTAMAVQDLDEGAYCVPLVGGPEHLF